MSTLRSFQMLQMVVWRRRFLLMAIFVAWAFFYFYLHYSNEFVPDGASLKQPMEQSIQPAASSPLDESHYKHMTVEEIRVHKMNEEMEKEKHSHKSVREKYMGHGVKLESVQIQLKTSTEKSNISTPLPLKETNYIPPLRIVHLDLKGAPPKITFFKSLFPLLKSSGANGLLMEYEDTFPFYGPLASIKANNAYTKKHIRYILELARSHDLHVIPLIQTFGHLEFVLKLPEFKHLREVEDIPQSLCPTNNGSLVLIKTMVDQVLSMHNDARWLHIGCDEVYQLGHCSRCSRYDRSSLFLAYVRKVATYVREKHRITPIIWDDMLRHMSVQELEKYDMGKLVEPMAWSYVEDVYLFLPSSLWERYSQVFPNIWTASAYKGAFGETRTIPDAKRHLENNKAWLNVMNEQNSSFKGFRGIVLTGWQRYDHFASLCELLPASLPSLLLNVIVVSKGNFDETVFPQMQELLECSSRRHYHLDLQHDPFLWRALAVCFFPGSSVFRLTLRHSDVAKSLDKYLRDISEKGWMTEYNMRHNFSSPLRVDELLHDFSYYNSSLQMLQEAAVKALREIYEDDTVSEWIELNIYPYVEKMNRIWEHGVKLKKHQVWPRRPLPSIVRLPSPPLFDVGVLKS